MTVSEDVAGSDVIRSLWRMSALEAASSDYRGKSVDVDAPAAMTAVFPGVYSAAAVAVGSSMTAPPT